MKRRMTIFLTLCLLSGLALWSRADRSAAASARSATPVYAAINIAAPLVTNLVVNSTADADLATLAGNATCDLREAIQAANTGATVGQCTIAALDTAYTINLPAGTITLTGAASEDANASGDLDLTAVVGYTLLGNAGGTIIDGGLNDRHFDVRVAATLDLQSLTLRNGRANEGGALSAPFSVGFTLTATNVIFSGNEATGGGGAIDNGRGRVELSFTSFLNNRSGSGFSGGAYSSDQDAAVLVVSNSRFEGNQGTRGGAIYIASGGFTITDSLFVNNSADDGGALYNNEDQAPYTISGSAFAGNNAPRGSALFLSRNSTQSNITINNSTFAGNVAPDRASSGGSGAEGGAILVIGSSSAVTLRHVTLAQNQGVNRPGGLRLQSGDANIFNTIIANNTGGNCLLFGSGAMITGANNLTDAAGMCSPGFTIGDPMLGSLAYNGGPLAGASGSQTGIPTLPLLIGSAAVDAGAAAASLPTDQRGVARPQGAAPDIGAYELIPNAAPSITASGVTRTAGSPASNSQIATVNDAEDAENTLAVTVNSSSSATVNGVTVSGLSVNASGQVTASVVAACTATNAGFTLRVTDSGGLFAEATFNVTVAANPAPSLGNYPNATITVGGSATVAPASPPADNVSINSVTVMAPGFTGTTAVNAATGAVSISNANPVGGFLVTVKATDNCGAMTTKTFTLTVAADTCGITVNPATLPQPYVAVPYLRILSATPAGNYTFSVSSGQLPPGLQLVTVFGVTSIAGLPATPGTYNFMIKAKKNGTTCEGTRSYTVTIPATIVPILECVQHNANNTYTARFGYLNQTSSAVTILVGSNNYFTPGNQNRGQTTVFQPGRVANAFSVTFAKGKGSNLAIWFLRGPDGVLRPVNVLTTSIGCP